VRGRGKLIEMGREMPIGIVGSRAILLGSKKYVGDASSGHSVCNLPTTTPGGIRERLWGKIRSNNLLIANLVEAPIASCKVETMTDVSHN